MAMSEEMARAAVKRLLLSRLRILTTNGFYGLLLMHAKFALDESCQTAYTDGEKIAFSPAFLASLSDRELDFVMMHEIMHIVLQHCFRGEGYEHERFNIACDIVVNSNILKSNDMDLFSITLKQWGESMHLAPNGKEGYLYTAEEVYKMLPKQKEKKGGAGAGQGKGAGGASNADKTDGGGWDDHTKWGTVQLDDDVKDLWVKRFEDACEAIEIREACQSRGTMPAFAKRIWEDLKNPQTDWRTILQEFVQQEVNDYSFSPPDRRFSDSPFFLPDYNEKEDLVQDVLFMVDTSGSMSDKMLKAAYGEIKGAIDQFGGALKGWLGFFDAAVIAPIAFESVEEFQRINAAGGGGTSFSIIFRYVEEYMQDKRPACIVILTDGYAPFPPESAADGIPVLWLLNNEDITPPWGKIARIKV